MSKKPVAPTLPVEESLHTTIRKVRQAMDALRSSGLNKRAIIALVHDQTRITKSTIEQVLDSLNDLERVYCER